MDSIHFSAFMLRALALNLTPGPDMAFVVSQGSARGTRAGVMAALGIGAGTIVHIVLAALGLAVVLARFPLAFDAIRYAGAAYLVWIAIGLFRRGAAGFASAPAPRAGAAFRQGALTNMLNPKVALFFLAFLPQFLVADGAPYWRQTLALGAAFDASGTLINLAVALLAGKLAALMTSDPRVARGVNWFAGGVMCALAAKLALARR